MKGAISVMCGVLLTAVFNTAQPAAARDIERTFERQIQVANVALLDVRTKSGRVDIRSGREGVMVVRGTVKRNVSWRGAQVTDAQIAGLRDHPPIRLDGDVVRIERIPDDALANAVSIDFDIVVPSTANIAVETGSGAISVAGSRAIVRGSTGSGAIRVDSDAEAIDLSSGSGGIRVMGRSRSITVRSGSGAVQIDAEKVGLVHASTGSGSLSVSGIDGTVDAETGSGRLVLAGRVTGDWSVRSRSGSVSIRVGSKDGFDLSAESRSGNVTAKLPYAPRGEQSKHRVVGKIGAGGPRLEIETGSSSIRIE